MFGICGCRCVSIGFEATPRDQICEGAQTPHPSDLEIALFQQNDTVLYAFIFVSMPNLYWPVMVNGVFRQTVFLDGPSIQAYSNFGNLLNTGVTM